MPQRRTGMAIYVRCLACKQNNKLKTAKCSKCGVTLKENNSSYKVQVKLSNGRYKTQQVDSLTLAKKIESKFKVQRIENKVFDIAPVTTLGYAWEQYLSWAKLNKKTWPDDLARWTNHVAPELSSRKMDSITPSNIINLVSAMQQKQSIKGTPFKPATIKQVLVLTKRLFNWAIEKEIYHGTNPAAKVKPPRFDNRVNNPLGKDGIAGLLNILSSWDNERASLVVKFALYSGRRRGEILCLKWSNVNLEGGFVTFQGATTKNGTTQTLPLNNRCKEVLERCKELEVSDYVFPTSTGKFYAGFDCIWERIRRKAGLSIRFHDLRHTYASFLASSGEVDIYTLKELLGHKSLDMTQRYAHLINGSLKRAVNVADTVF